MLVLRSIFYTLLMPGTITVLIPYLLLSNETGWGSSRYQALRYTGLLPITIGTIGLIWCIWRFYAEGQGTLAPIDPPKNLVVRGLYRNVRNPMYLSVILILLGEAIVFLSEAVLIEAGVFFVIVHLFVMLYEEPVLRRQFGGSYEKYMQTVRRWIPHFPDHKT